jgi:hypothetical protein
MWSMNGVPTTTYTLDIFPSKIALIFCTTLCVFRVQGVTGWNGRVGKVADHETFT